MQKQTARGKKCTTIEDVFRAYIESDASAWEGLLAAAQLTYNSAVHNSSGLIQFELMIGDNPLRANDLDVADVLEPRIASPMTNVFEQLIDRRRSYPSSRSTLKDFAD